MKNIAILSFTGYGAELAEILSRALGGTSACTRNSPEISLASWTAENFPVRDALIYIGAVGIAVRGIAPYVRDKTKDPAVIAVDELGRFAVPLCSGHLGGANDLARKIAAITGGTAVITTATDLHGIFAVDEWAKRQNCAIVRPEGIKTISGKLLTGQNISVFSAFPIDGEPPDGVNLIENNPSGRSDLTDLSGGSDLTDSKAKIDSKADIIVDIRMHDGFVLVPRILTLGVGCRRNTDRETLEVRFQEFCGANRIWPEAFHAAATINIKGSEPGLLAFCAAHGWKLHLYSAEELRQVSGTFTASAFVEEHTGVNNVCERAAVLHSGGKLLIQKDAGTGVTLAAAQMPYRMDWRWQYGNTVCCGNRTGGHGFSDG